MRIVLDSGALLDAFFDRSPAGHAALRILLNVFHGHVAACASKELAEEYVVAFAFRVGVNISRLIGNLDWAAQKELPPSLVPILTKFDKLLERMERVSIEGVAVPFSLPADASDACLIKTAYVADADFIVAKATRPAPLPVFRTRSGRQCAPIDAVQLVNQHRQRLPLVL